MGLYAGIDLHASNSYLAVVKQDGRKCFEQRLPNDRQAILGAVKPFRSKLQGIVVESTFNWY